MSQEGDTIALYEMDLSEEDPLLNTSEEVEIPGGIAREGIYPEQRAPFRPGEILERVYLKPLGLTQEQFAERVGVSRRLVNEIVNGKRRVTPRTAMKFGKALQTSPLFWMNLQDRFELWELSEDKDLQSELVNVESVA
ncbi:MAG: HigA family addiction module antitoxin [bacterium]